MYSPPIRAALDSLAQEFEREVAVLTARDGTLSAAEQDVLYGEPLRDRRERYDRRARSIRQHLRR